MSKNLGVDNYNMIANGGDYAFRVQAGFSDEFHMWCPKFRVCYIKVHREPQNVETATWHFNGDYDAPTIAPSINCDTAPRCGRHLSVVNGVIQVSASGGPKP